MKNLILSFTIRKPFVTLFIVTLGLAFLFNLQANASTLTSTTMSSHKKKTKRVLKLASAGVPANTSANTKGSQPNNTKPDSLDNEINSLGEDNAVVQRAQSLSPNNKVEIVQKRAVDRNNRLELGVDYGIVGGGDSYLSSQTFGGHIDYHINPHWSLGVRYSSYINNLTSEGQAVFANAQQVHAYNSQQVSPVDSPIQTALFVADWYPIYGKLNIFNWIMHFDIYTLLGYGKTETEQNGWSNTYTAGAGIGFWLSNSLALRLEGRYETFQDRPSTVSDPRSLSTFMGQASLGILL